MKNFYKETNLANIIKKHKGRRRVVGHKVEDEDGAPIVQGLAATEMKCKFYSKCNG